MSNALLGLIIVLGAALRFYDVGAESYQLDEIDTLLMGQEGLRKILVESEGRPPVYLLVAHFWMQIFGTTEAATRSLSALAGVASIALMYAVGHQFSGRKVGLLSALLMAISEFQIFYSQDYRYYSLFVLMTLLSFLFCIRALRSRKPSHFALYVLASILLVYTQTPGVFVLAAQNLYFLLQWNRYRKVRTPWLLCQTLILLALGPGLFLAVKATKAGAILDWIPDPPLWRPLLTVLKYVFPLTVIRGRRYPSWITLAAGMAFFVTGTLVFATWKGKERWLASLKDLVATAKDRSSQTDELLLVGCWLLCPVVLPFVLSKVFVPMFIQQYTISAAPALYLLLALGITTVRKVVPELVSLGVLLILIVPGLQEYYPVDIKEQWREAAVYMEENGRKDDVIVFAPDGGGGVRSAFDWYYQGNLSGCGIGAGLSGDDAIADALAQCTSGSERFWLIIRGPDHLTAHLRAFFLDRDNEAMRLTREQEFKDISVYLFALTGDD